MALSVFCGGIVGAKLPFVLSDWDGLLSGRAWFEKGKTIVFGLIGACFLHPEPIFGLGLTGYEWAILGLIPVFGARWIRDAGPARSPAQEPAMA